MMLSCQNSYLREARESQKVFSALVNAMEKSHKAVVAAIEERQREEEKRVKALLEELEHAVQEMRKGTTECEISVNSDESGETKQMTVVSTFICSR